MVMLVLNARFALLAAFCSLATMTFSSRWGVDAAAIQPRPFDHDHCHNVTSDRPSAQYVLPLPLKSKTKQFKVRTHEWLYSNPVALFSDIVFTRLKRDDNTPGEACNFRKHGDYRYPAGMTRRSVLIPDKHGSEYVVSHSRRPVRRRRRRAIARTLNGIEDMPLSRRAQDARVGYVALMSPDYDSVTGRQIAKLFAAPKGHEAWVLYASETNQTQFRLVNTPASVESTSDLTPVTLEMGAPGETRTCATYNSSPPQDESDTQDSENMTMEPCTDRATPEASYKSQIFMYNGTSGTLEPTWNSADGADTAAASPSVNQNSTSSSNATVTSSAVQAAATLFANRADTSTPQNSTNQNSTVTLVFTPMKAMTDVGIQENFTTTGTTTTMTKTVTVFNVESTSTGVPSSTSNAAARVTATSSALDVQLVGAPIPFSNATGTTTIGSTSVSTSSSTATGSIDAAAIASRIAATASTASADVSSTTINSASPSSTQAAQRRENVRMVQVASTEPYTWMFKAEER